MRAWRMFGCSESGFHFWLHVDVTCLDHHFGSNLIKYENVKEFLSSAFKEYLCTQKRFYKTFRTTLLNWTELRKEISALSWMWCELCLRLPDYPGMNGLKLYQQPVISRIDLQVQASQLHMSCGLEPSLKSGLRFYMCTEFVHVSKEMRKNRTINMKNAS